MFKSGSCFNLFAPVDGKVLDISMVPDKVFSNRIVGDGVAIQPEGNIITAPEDGELSVVFKKNYGFGMVLDNKVEVLVHVGIDTFQLNGEGFERIAEEGTKVKKGTPILKFDRKYVEKKGYSVIVPVIITNIDIISSIGYNNVGSTVSSGKDTVVNYKIV